MRALPGLGLAILLASGAGYVATAPHLAMPGAVAFFFFLVIGVGVLTLSPQLARPMAYLCIALMFLDLSPVSVGSSVRAYHPLSLVLVAGLFRVHQAPARFGPLMKWLVAFTLAVGTSIFWTISFTDTLVVSVGQAYLLYLFVVICVYLSWGIVTVSGVMNALLVGASISSLFAVLQFLAAYGGSTWQIYDVYGIPWHRPAGLMLEPDWAGLTAAVGLILAYFRPRRSVGRGFALTVCALAVTITAVRAVWVALIVVILVSFFSAKPVRALAWRAFPVLVVGFFILVSAVLLNPTSLSRFSPSAVAASHGDTGALNSRLGVLRLVADRADEAFLEGHGAGSLNFEASLQENRIEYVGGGDLNAGRGSTNLFATNLWDLGVPGFVIVVGLALSWMRGSWRLANTLPALFPLTTLLLVDFQINNGIRFGFVWVVMAVVSYAAAQDGNVRPEPVEATEVASAPNVFR